MTNDASETPLSRGAPEGDDSGDEIVAKKSKFGLTLVIVSFNVVMGIFAFTAFREQASSNNYSPARMQEIAEKLNRDLPKMIDPQTRLERVIVDRKLVTYQHRLLLPDGLAIPADRLDAFRPKIISKVCGASETREILRHGFTMRYSYTDSKDQILFVVDATEAACGQ